MSVSAEPGQEDLPSLSALRMGAGARIVSVYVTDGGATPSDIDGSIPLLVGARRKSEADGVMEGLGGESCFLGFPDYGFVSRRETLEKLWNRDSLLARLVFAIRTYRPDVIMVASDARAPEGDTVRSELIRGMILEAANVSAHASPGDPSIPAPWTVSRIFEEMPRPGGTFGTGAGRVDPFLKKSYAGIGAEQARGYRSLRRRIGEWNGGREGAYRLLRGRSGPSGGVLDGLPVIPPSLTEAAADVNQAALESAKADDEATLRFIVRAIARVEKAIMTRRDGLTALEKRLLLSWKEKLEELRCAVLNVDLRFDVSDTVIARRQLFTLRFPKDRRFPAGGRSEIIFPLAIDSTWLINNSEGYRFSFALPDTFALITPEQMELNRPVATIGSGRFRLSTRMPFVVVHKDTDPLRDFACRREIVLGVSPVQTAEILTPFVRVTPGERLVVRLRNISREPYRGSLWVLDSVARESRMPVTLRRGDGPRVDTLRLGWADAVPDGDYIVDLHVGKGRMPVGNFTARKFDAVADTSRPVGLYTGLAGSPVEDALRRLHIPCRLLDGSFDGSPSAPIRTIIVDRDAFALRPDAAHVAEAIAVWVREGGHCVMLRQSPGSTKGNPLSGTLEFARTGVIPPESPVKGDTAAAVLSAPNSISREDWEGWIIARAQSPIVAPPGSNPAVQLEDELTGAPLVATVNVGKGRLTAVALDLLPQLQIVHPGAYRLFANIVSN
jgi:hypothetical protein